MVLNPKGPHYAVLQQTLREGSMRIRTLTKTPFSWSGTVGISFDVLCRSIAILGLSPLYFGERSAGMVDLRGW